MPDNTSPAAQPESRSEPAEFNFDHPASENPRIKRRSLKALKSATATPSAARELEREAPPIPAEGAAPPASVKAETKPAAQVQVRPEVPPRITPSISSNATAAATAAKPSPATSAPKTASSASPHGTRPATLYYSSYPKKEIPSSMKTTTNAVPAASTSSSSTAAAPASATRAAVSSTASARPSTVNIDYRANVERQSREQKSVGNILAYFVYGLIAVFVISGGLAIYGSVIIFGKLHDQSATLSDLDAKYALKVNALNTQIAATQDTLAQAQAQIARQQDLINRQQEDLGRLITAMTDNATAIKDEKQARAQETAALRSRVRTLEYKTTVQKF